MSAGDSRPPSDDSSVEEREDGDESFLTRLRTAEDGPLMFVREVLTSVAAVAAIGLLLFAIAGVWPPMVAVESGSMQPHMQKGDLVFITEPQRFAPDAAFASTGVVTHQKGQRVGYKTFGSYGSVIVYNSPTKGGPPIIHRARLHVEEGENWFDEANKSYIRAESCDELDGCPAPYSGFITKGDHNSYYDQASDIAPVVKEEWVTGVARVRVPYLGWIRLAFSDAAAAAPTPTASASGSAAAPTGGPNASVSGGAPAPTATPRSGPGPIPA